MLDQPLDALMGATSKVRLLRMLLPRQVPVSGREAARLAGVSWAAASQSLRDLVDLRVLRVQRTTGQHLYSLNRDHVLVPILAQVFEAEQERRRAVIEAIQGKLSALKRMHRAPIEVLTAAFFGSAVRGDEIPGSDVDLLVVVRSKAAEEPAYQHLIELSMVLRDIHGVLLSPIVFTLSEFCERYSAGDSFLHGVVAASRTIFGPANDLEEFVRDQTRAQKARGSRGRRKIPAHRQRAPGKRASARHDRA